MLETRNPGAKLDDIERLYRERFPTFVRAAVTVLGNADAARDAVQEAFARAVRSRRSFDGRGSLEAWLFRIVVNTARGQARSDERPTKADPVAFTWNGGYREPEEAALRLLISQLPERQRLALFLRFYADLDYEQIARVLGVRPGTVAATLNAARSSLRRRLEEVRS